MGSKTRIIILQMKEIIYTVILPRWLFCEFSVCLYVFLKKGSESRRKRHPHLHIPRAFTPHPLSSATTR